MVSVCLPTWNTYCLTWVSLTLDEGYLLTAAPPGLERGIAPLGPPVPAQPPLLGHWVAPPALAPGLGHGVSLHGCSSKAQPLLLTLDEGYLLTTALPDLECGIVPLGPPAPTQPPLLGRGVAPPGRWPWPRAGGCSSGCSCTIAAWHSRLLTLTLDMG